jgi:hypothetical protein
VCPFGCRQGFLNDYALFRHIQKSLCEDAEDLFGEIKICRQCNSTAPDIVGALNHLTDHHDIFVGNSPYICAPCAVVFLLENHSGNILHSLVSKIMRTPPLWSLLTYDFLYLHRVIFAPDEAKRGSIPHTVHMRNTMYKHCRRGSINIRSSLKNKSLRSSRCFSTVGECYLPLLRRSSYT